MNAATEETPPQHWSVSADGKGLEREFKTADYDKTMALCNAVAGIARDMNHHPDMQVGYNRLKVRFSTHSAGGLSPLDFEAARRVNAL